MKKTLLNLTSLGGFSLISALSVYAWTEVETRPQLYLDPAQTSLRTRLRCESDLRSAQERLTIVESQLERELKSVIARLPRDLMERMSQLQERLSQSRKSITDAELKLVCSRAGEGEALSSLIRDYQAATQAEKTAMAEAAQLKSAVLGNRRLEQAVERLAKNRIKLQLAGREDGSFDLVITDELNRMEVRTKNGNPFRLASASQNRDRMIESLSTECQLYFRLMDELTRKPGTSEEDF